MFNFFKNSLRGLLKNKILVIGLSFLIFLSSSIYTILSSTTTNISSQYTSISQKSVLHDLTINEKYDIGTIKYSFIGTNKNEQRNWFEQSDDLVGYSTETDGTNNLVSWGKYDEQDDGTYLTTYRMELDITQLNSNSIAYQAYANIINQATPWTDPFYQYIFPKISIITTYDSSNPKPTYEDSDSFYSTKELSAILTELDVDKDKVTKALNGTVSYLNSNILDYYSPLKKILDDPDGKYYGRIQYRNFKSINIDNADPNQYYKMVVSHNDSVVTQQKGDLVDKMNIFSGMTNFSDNDWQIDVQKINNVTPTINDILSYEVPQTQPAPNTNEYLKAQNKFKVLSVGHLDFDQKLNINFASLAVATDGFPATDYNNYFNLQKSEVFYNKGYRYTLNWIFGSLPYDFYIDDWTSKFTVIAPQYASQHNIVPATNDIYIKYSGYHGPSNPKKIDIANWFNSMTQDEFEAWFLWVQNNFSNNVINIAHGTPYIVVGTGITADFLYPIVSIERPTPNFSIESINYISESGYNRIYDSFRSNATEKYIVCKSIDYSSVQSLINDLQKTCNQIMNWPPDTKCVYAANDTNNHLSAAAFRIVFIPKLISSIQLIDTILTLFVLILCVIICGTFIRRDIEANRSNIGIMQANGIGRKTIILISLPFVIISTIIGTISGYIFGLFMQVPTLSLFSNYWTIPTSVLAFNWVTFCLVLFVPMIVLVIVSICSVYIVLRIKTTYLMKSGSEYRVNVINKFIKMPFSKFDIITRFRVSLAFNSWWKLIVFSVITCLIMSSVTFAITISGKFDQSITTTNNAKHYDYAIDLFTPTEQSGQYIPVDKNEFAQSGWINTSEGINFMPNIYFQDEISNLRTKNTGQIIDQTYTEILKNSSYGGTQIAKSYYDVAASQGGFGNMGVQNHTQVEIMQAMGQNTNTVFPTGADSVGQKYDLQYMKNRTITKTVLDHDVGSTKTGYTNAWDYSASLMPENQLNRINAITDELLQLAFMKANPGAYNASNKHPSINLPGYDHNSSATYENPYSSDASKNNWINKNYGQFFSNNALPETAKPDYQLNPDTTVDTFKVPLVGITGKTNLTPEYMKFIATMYSELEWPNSNGEITSDSPMAITEDYQVKYNQVPLSESDETYTYLDITNDTIFNKQVSNDAKIVGIKQNSQYISLLNNKKDISPLIYNYPSQISSDSYFPIIINKFAQKKYGLKVDSKFSMNINNTTDRYYKTIHDVSPSSVFNFKVVGICDTYIGEEYYVAQDVANYILGLKTHLLDQQTQIQNGPHSYYFDSTKAIQISGENLDRARTSTPSDNTGLGDGARILNDVSYFPTTTYSSMDSDHFIQRKPDGLPNYTQDSEGNFDPNPGVKYDVNNLYDLNDNSDNKITNDNLTGNVTPYGFNGVFTDSKHGDYLVNNCAYIYAPSGIYPANDKFSNDTLTTLFKYGANAQIVSQILGLWISPNNPNNTDLGNKIYNSWRQWMYDGDETTGWTIKTDFGYDIPYTDDQGVSHPNGDLNYVEYASYIPQLISLLINVFGNSSVVSLIETVNNKTASQAVFKHFVLTVNEILTVILCVILLMTIIVTMLLSSLIINSTKRLAAILKALGYRDHINIVSILSIYFPTLLLGFVVSIPISFILLTFFNSLIFNLLGLLLITNPLLMTFITSLVFVTAMYFVFMTIGYITLKKEKLNVAIKWI